jgi:hypothetical protein
MSAPYRAIWQAHEYTVPSGLVMGGEPNPKAAASRKARRLALG